MDHQKRLEMPCSKYSFRHADRRKLHASTPPMTSTLTQVIYIPAGLCNQTWYCSAHCQQAHWSGQLPTVDAEPAAGAAAVTAHSRHLVPHSLTCAVLKRFSSIKCNPGMESVIKMCLDAMALQYMEGKPPHGAESSFTDSPSNQPDPGYKTKPKGLPQQLVHPLNGQQTLADQQAPHVSPTQPTDVASAHESWPQLQSMSIRSSSQTCKQCCSKSSQAVPPTSAPSHADLCGQTSYASQTHAASMEAVQTASDLSPSLPAKTQGLPAAQLPCMTHAQLTQLQSHAADFTDKDRRDWLINLRFLRNAMQQAHWPGDIWSEDALLDMVGRIASNNFGIYSTRQGAHPQQPQQPVDPSKPCEPRAVPDQAASCQSQCSLSPDSTHQHSKVQLEFDQTMHHNMEEKELPPRGLSPLAKEASASKQPASPRAEAHSAAVLQEVLPWPLQADAHSHSPLHCPSEPAVAEGITPQGCFPTADRAQQQQPFQPDSHRPLFVEQCSGQVKPSSNRGLKHPANQLPPQGRPAKEDVVGREMYITASFFNHSCEPNCVKHRLHGQQSGVAEVTTLRDIKASHTTQTGLRSELQPFFICSD